MSTIRRFTISIGFALLTLLGVPRSFAYQVNPTFVRVPTTSDQVSGSTVIDGSKGGSLTVGRFTVNVPKGAYIGNATVSIQAPDPTTLRCELGISGTRSILGFLKPVTLQTDCRGAVDVDPSNLQVIWFNEAQSLWVLVPNTILDLKLTRLLTPLWHFSQYGVVDGKAGW